MVNQHQHQDSTLPTFLQTSEGKLSLPALVGVIFAAMVVAIFFTIAVYIVVVRNFHKFFEVQERVSGQHMSFFQAVESERLTSPLKEQREASSSSSFSSSSSTSSEKQQEYDSDFENVEEITTPKQTMKITNQRKQQSSPSSSIREKDLYLSSAREVSV